MGNLLLLIDYQPAWFLVPLPILQVFLFLFSWTPVTRRHRVLHLSVCYIEMLTSRASALIMCSQEEGGGPSLFLQHLTPYKWENELFGGYLPVSHHQCVMSWNDWLLTPVVQGDTRKQKSMAEPADLTLSLPITENQWLARCFSVVGNSSHVYTFPKCRKPLEVRISSNS